MDVKQLTALVAIAETGSVTRAAEVLHLVQPAVTRQVRLLEEELGAPLFDRTRQGMRLTDDGQILLEHARRALGELERARAEIRPVSGELRGVVTVGLSPSFAEPIGEALVARLAAEHPGVQLRLSIGYTRHLTDWLDAADIDFAVIFDVRPASAVEVRPLLEEPLWVVGPPGSDLSAEHPVQFADVADRIRIHASPTHAMRNMLERVAAEQKIRLRVTVETNSMQVQRRLAAAGSYYTVLPSIAVRRGHRRRHPRRRALDRPRTAPAAAAGAPRDPPRRSRRARGGRTARRGDAPLRPQRCLALGHVARQNTSKMGVGFTRSRRKRTAAP